MEDIDHLGVVGGHPMGDHFARLAEADDYCVHRFGFDGGKAQMSKLEEIPHRVTALCVCASGPPALFRVVAEYLRVSGEYRPTYLFNISTVGVFHVRCIDALLRRLAPTTTFAEAAFLGGARAIEDREATAIYASRSGPPDRSVERFLLGFATRVIEFQDVTEASAAKLVNDVFSLLTGLATHEALAVGQQCGISTEDLAEILSLQVPNGGISASLAASGSEHWSELRWRPQKEMNLLLTRASEMGLKDIYIRLLTELCEGSGPPPLVGEES